MALLTWFPGFLAGHERPKKDFLEPIKMRVVGSEFSGLSAEIPPKAGGDGNALLLQLFTLKFPQTSRVGSS